MLFLAAVLQLLRCLDKVAAVKGENEDQQMGISILLRAIEEPMRQIVANAGDEPSVIVNKVKESSGNEGYNAQTGEYRRHDLNGYS